MTEPGPDEPIEAVYSDLTDFFRESPLAYAGYRISELKKRGSDISEAGEIPLVTSPLFPVALVGYVLLARAKHLLRRRDGTDPLPADGHLFSMTSSHGYRTHTFLEVAEALQEAGEDVCLLCSPAAADERGAWERRGLPTTTHRRLHGRVGILRLAASAVRSAVLTARLWRNPDTYRSLTALYQYYNFVLLEHVKRESLRELTANDPNVHTFSAMPYLVVSTTPGCRFAYQHGLQMPDADRILSLPFFAPMHLFVWGEAWRDRFAASLHSESTVHVVGSPWYDYLASRRSDRDPETDVLFIGGSHGISDPDVVAAYEQLVGNTVERCERNGYSLAVKLHPLESPAWYEERGWGEYVAEFDDIDEALLEARVSVTNGSTAFVESAVLGVPAIVGDLFGNGLADLSPVDFVRFTEGPDVGDAIVEAVEGGEFRSEGSRPLIDLGESRNRIVDIVLNRTRRASE